MAGRLREGSSHQEWGRAHEGATEAGGVPEGNPFRCRRWQCMHVDLGEIAD